MLVPADAVASAAWELIGTPDRSRGRAGIGLVFAVPLTKLVLSMAGRHGGSVTLDANLDWRTLLFTVAIALVTALLFGLAPAFRATRVDLTPALKDGAGVAQGSRPQLRVSRLLIAGQVALSTLLLAGAGLFVRTLMNLSTIDPGFQTQRLLVFDVDGSQSGYGGDKLLGFYESIREKVAAIPGVRSATLSDPALLRGSMSNDYVEIPGHAPKGGKQTTAYVLRAGSHFLTTMEIPLLMGRDLGTRDVRKAPRVGIVNEKFARDYFGEGNPLGRFFYFGDGKNTRPEDRVEIAGVCKNVIAMVNEAFVQRYFPDGRAIGQRVSAAGMHDPVGMQIVGVVKNAISQSLRDDPPPAVYAAIYQRQIEFPTFVVRASGSLTQVASSLRSKLQPRLLGTAIQVHTLTAQVEAALVQERLMATLAASFGALAVVLAAIGLYGLLAYTVARRTSEIGIRMALGANRVEVMWLVIHDAARLLALGVVAGLPVAWGASRLISAMLFGLTATDPATIFAAAAILIAAGLLAGYLPARRASRVDPMVTLRYE